MARLRELWAPPTRLLTIGLILTITFVASESLAVITVMPLVARDLGGLRVYGWVFTAFMLASVVGVVAGGRATDRRGPAVPFVAGLVLFGSGLAIAGLATSMQMLVGGRTLQGLGAGVVPSVAYASIGRTLTADLRPRMVALISTAWVLPGLAGPAISAEIARAFGWRWVFLGLLPVIGLTGSIAVPPLIRLGAPDVVRASEHSLVDALRVTCGAAMILGGLTLGFGSRHILVACGLGCAGVVVALAEPSPAAPGRHLARPPRPARHHPQPRAADLYVLRSRQLRDALDQHRPACEHPGGRVCRHGRDGRVDHRRVDAGQDRRHVGGTQADQGRPADHPARHRRDDPDAAALGTRGGGHRGLDCSGPGHGPRQLADHAPRAAAGAARPGGPGGSLAQPG